MDDAQVRLRIRQLAPVIALFAAGILSFGLGFGFEALPLKGILVALVALVGAAILVVPYSWAIVILFLYLGVEGMGKLLTNYNPLVHVGADILVLALATKWFFSLLLRKTTWPERLPPLTGLLLMHWAWFAIEFANPYSLSLFASLAGTKLYVTMVLLYFFGYYLVTSARAAHRFLIAWIAVLALQVVTCFYQSAAGPKSVLAWGPAAQRAMEKYVGYAFRPFGTTSQPGAASMFVWLATPFLIYLFMRSRRLLPKALVLALLPPAFFTLVLCEVRSALVKAVLATLIFLFLAARQSSWEIRRRVVGFVAVGALALFVAIPAMTARWSEATSDTNDAVQRSLTVLDLARVKSARAGAWDRIALYGSMVPLGAGLSRTGPAATKFSGLIADDPYFRDAFFFTDNFWAATIVDLGIPGSLILTTILVSIILSGFLTQKRIEDPELRLLHACLISPLLPMCIGLWGGEGVLYNPEAPYFWFFAGAMMRIPELSARAAEERKKESSESRAGSVGSPAL